MGVASIVLDLSFRLGISDRVLRYGVAWALLHDISTWPLSHTGEAAFSSITGVDSATLRSLMIRGSRILPEELWLAAPLAEMGVDAETLLALFEKRKDISAPLFSGPDSAEFEMIWDLIHSPITPDTLEGISRTGRTLGVMVPEPHFVYAALSRYLYGGIYVPRPAMQDVYRFWRKKGMLYDQYINDVEVINWESSCSRVLQYAYSSIPLVESLYLDESELVRRLENDQLFRSPKLLRYKFPRYYFVAKRLCNASLPSSMLLSELQEVLKSEKKELGNEPKRSRGPNTRAYIQDTRACRKAL